MSRFLQPSLVNLSQIQVKVAPGDSDQERKQAHAKAEEILKKVQADKSAFAEIAKTESQDAGTAKDGGKLGWITKGSWPANLETVVFALQKGGVSDVVDGPGGYHIFQPNEIQPEKGESFDRSEEHTSELQSLMRISYDVFCLQKKTTQ